MPISKEGLRQLVRLQEQDKVVDSLQAAIDNIPVEIQGLRSSLDSWKSRLAEAKNKTTRLQLARKEKELSLGQKEEAVRKHGTELNSVKSNEAYKALQQEIDKAKAEAGELETAVLTLMDEIDQAAREEKAEAARFKEAEARIQGEIQSLEGRRAELEEKAGAERAKRETLTPGAPAETMKLYDYLRRRKQGAAMSVAKGNICGACRIVIPPQSLVELARGTALVTCEACQRILYSPELLAEVPVAKSEGDP